MPSSTAFLPAPAPLLAPSASRLSHLPRRLRPLPLARPAPPRYHPAPTLALSQPRARAAALAEFTPPEPDRSQRVTVQIHSPARNRRVIVASNLIHAPLPVVWELLSDYSHLADHIPNLRTSRLRPHPRGGIRLEQCGAQSILGFTFSASLVMDMLEVDPTSDSARAIDFTLVSSADFNIFDGRWHMVRLDDNKTALYYSVDILPKGIVPVRAIEWRISEDVPGNMDAVRVECERRRRLSVAAARRQASAADQ